MAVAVSSMHDDVKDSWFLIALIVGTGVSLVGACVVIGWVIIRFMQ
jgi:hypothetical protein